MIRFRPFLGVLLLAMLSPGSPLRAGAVYGRVFLAAGNGNPDFKDGDFEEASLHGPSGLALSADGAKLYIADTFNDSIRLVDFNKGSALSTVAGKPGDANWLSPTALVFSRDQKTIYAIAGAERSLHCLSLADGSLKEVKLKHLSALAQHPAVSILYAFDGDAGVLYVIDETNGNSLSMTALPELTGVQGEMLANSQGLYFLRSGNGELGSFVKDGHPITYFDSPSLEAHRDLRWDRLSYFGPGANGLASSMDLNGPDVFLWIWDESAGIFKKMDAMNGLIQDYPLKDLNGKWLKTPAAFEASPIFGDNSVQASTRALFRGPLAMVADPARNLLYVAEANGNRVVGLQHPRWDAKRLDSLPDYESGDKVPGVTRILLLGDSMVFSGDPAAGDPPYLEAGFGERLQTYLNFLCALKGKKRRFEVIEQSVAFGAMGGGMTSYYVNLPADLNALHADEVITLLTYMNLNGEVIAMTRTKSPDDVPWALVDPEFFGQSPEEMSKNYGPLHRAFLAWTATAPPAVQEWVQPQYAGTRLNLPRGDVFDQPISDPGYRSWVIKIHSKILDAAVKRAKAENTKLTEVLLPLRNHMSPGENEGGGLVSSDSTLANWMDADLESVAAARGVSFINLTTVLRSMEPSFFPLVGYGTHHFRTQGVNWAALATAVSYVDRLP